MNSISVDPDFNCELIVLQIEDTLFPVLRTIFSESPIFEDMFSVPQPSGVPVEGSSKEHPLKLEGVRKEDFTNLMRLFMPMRSANAHVLLPNLGKDVWLSILHLSHMWQIASLRAASIQQLGTLVEESSEKLLLAEQYDVPKWNIPALLDLVNREPILTKDDLQRIGIDRALKVVELRERRFRAQVNKNPKCKRCRPAGATQDTSLSCKDIEDAFGL